jgi:uncharacterized membrane protein YiaA
MNTVNNLNENIFTHTQDMEKPIIKKNDISKTANRPTSAFIGASWLAMITGAIGYCIGLWNAEMELNEKGYYFSILLFGLFAVISLQKTVRDKSEGLPVTDIYYGISWFVTITSIALLIIGLWNADLLLSEKGFYAMCFVLSLFGSIAVQKNTRDLKAIDAKEYTF